MDSEDEVQTGLPTNQTEFDKDESDDDVPIGQIARQHSGLNGRVDEGGQDMSDDDIPLLRTSAGKSGHIRTPDNHSAEKRRHSDTGEGSSHRSKHEKHDKHKRDKHNKHDKHKHDKHNKHDKHKNREDKLKYPGLSTRVKSEPESDYDDDDDYKPMKKTIKVEKVKDKVVKKETKVNGIRESKNEKRRSDAGPSSSPRKKPKKEPEEVWEWWKEAPKAEGVKWSSLTHRGPWFPPAYEPLPATVVFRYDGQPLRLSANAEEVMGFYAKMLDHDYTAKDVFNKNFMHDWRKVMTHDERGKIADLNKCDFRAVHAYFTEQSEERKAASKEEKQKRKEENEAITKEFGFAMLDGHKEKLGAFRVEPPGLFRGRGDHPKMGKLKKRVQPEDVTINVSKGATPPPPAGHRWKEVKHDVSVTWLACWTENVQANIKYVMFSAQSKLKGVKDMQKYDKARELIKHVDRIRKAYTDDFQSKEMATRQRAVALYFIDKLALRAGNEKDEDQADTVGCCSLRVEHIKLVEEGDKYIVEFDFLGKDSIRYQNSVVIEKRVYKNLKRFIDGKKGSDELFDRLDTGGLNKYLNQLMEGLSAKVFRTFNASITLQDQLDKLTDPEDAVHAKMLAYNRANKEVAILCNHQRAIPKTFDKSMENLENKIKERETALDALKAEYKKAKVDCQRAATASNTLLKDKAKKKYELAAERLDKLRLERTAKDENKTVALGTSKLNYLDPRISAAWSKKHVVPIEKVYNKTQRQKFQWAIDMADETFVF